MITEIMGDPEAINDLFGEWFEVYNPTGVALDMRGLVVRDDGTDEFVVLDSVVVPPGAYVVLGGNADTASNGNVEVAYEYNRNSFPLSNDGGDEIVIVAPGNVVVDRVAYDSGGTFPVAIGRAMSLSATRLNAQDNDNGANWCAATTVYGAGDRGTPGQPNPTCP